MHCTIISQEPPTKLKTAFKFLIIRNDVISFIATKALWASQKSFSIPLFLAQADL